MASAQQQIMDAVKAALIAGNTVAGSRVYLDRVDPLPAASLPAIRIEDRGETSDVTDLDDTQQRQCTLGVQCILAHSTSAPTDARAFGLAVEKVIASSAAVKSLAHLGVYIVDSHNTADGDGEQLIAMRDQTWQANYVVQPTNPEIINP